MRLLGFGQPHGLFDRRGCGSSLFGEVEKQDFGVVGSVAVSEGSVCGSWRCHQASNACQLSVFGCQTERISEVGER